MSGRMGRFVRRLRARLPASTGHLAGTLHESELRLKSLSEGLENTSKLLVRFNESSERQLGELEATTKAIERRLEHAQALTARIYERQEAWPDRLEAVRREPGYEGAFSGEPLVSVRVGTYRNPEALCERALA